MGLLVLSVYWYSESKTIVIELHSLWAYRLGMHIKQIKFLVLFTQYKVSNKMEVNMVKFIKESKERIKDYFIMGKRLALKVWTL
mgnify:CR=1 FL=1